MTLSLMEAIREDRLGDFIAQEERRGVGPIPKANFETLAKRVIRTSQSADQTSGSLRSDGSSEK